MDFELTEEQKDIKRSVREFAEKEIRPHVLEWDETQHFPAELLPKLAQLGLMGVTFPCAYGGAGLGYQEYVLIMEELAKVDAYVALIVSAHNSLCSSHINLVGSEQQKRKFLLPLARGEKLGCWSLTDPGSGSDASALRSTARLEGHAWVLNGVKSFVTNGHPADLCVVMAITDKSKRKHGISAFIAEKGTPGFRAGKKEDKLGLRASDTAELTFEDCRIPKEDCLGESGEGFIDCLRVKEIRPHVLEWDETQHFPAELLPKLAQLGLMGVTFPCAYGGAGLGYQEYVLIMEELAKVDAYVALIDKGRIGTAAIGVGIAHGALEASVDYAKQRT